MRLPIPLRIKKTDCFLKYSVNMWVISNNRQMSAFFVSLVFGMGYALIYTFLKGIRKVVRHSPVMLFFEDIIFSVLTAYITFLLLLVLENGVIRFYILSAICIGFSLFYVFAAEVLSEVFSRVLKAVICILLRFKNFLKAIIAFFCEKISRICAFCGKKCKKTRKILKNILKAVWHMVYTKHSNTEDDKGVS